MSDRVAYRAVPLGQGEQAMSRLADRLTAMAPAMELSQQQVVPPYRPSAAVAAALGTSAAIKARAAERARRSRSVIGLTVDGFINICRLLSYSVVALAIRTLMAAVFFFDGQALVDGILVPLKIQEYFAFTFKVPTAVKTETVMVFTSLPIPAQAAAYVFSYAEFVLPLLLFFGLGARFAALGLLALTVFIQLFIVPDALWTSHVYWMSLLAVIVSLGAGKISIDNIIRMIARR